MENKVRGVTTVCDRGIDGDVGIAFSRNGRGEALVEQAREGHDGNVASFAIGNAEATDKLAFNTQALERFREQAAAAMNDKDLMAMLGKFCNMASEIFDQRRIFEQCTRKFDDDFHSKPVCSFIPNI